MNRRLRDQRRVIWVKAAAVARYWEARADFELAVWCAQDGRVPEGSFHPRIAILNRTAMLEKHREAVAKQLLTPAPDVGVVNWKRAVVAKGGISLLPVKKSRSKRSSPPIWLS